MGDTSTAVPDAAPAAARRGAVVRRLAYVLGLVPAAAGELVAVAVSGPAGGVDAARRHLDCRATAVPTSRVGGPRVVVHGALGVLVGLLSWWLVWMALVATARGPFYGLVVPGPYDDAWGGPNLVGAWAAHAWVWVATVLVVGLLLEGLGLLHVRLTEHLLGGRRRAWVVPVAVVVAGAAVLLVVAWWHQV
jgi:hypothetical protein